jgi:hypothetical protein
VKIEIEDHELDELIKEAIWSHCDGTLLKEYPNFNGLYLERSSEGIRNFADLVADSVLVEIKLKKLRKQ